MRNFLIKSAIFLTLCGLLDFGLGKIFGYLTVHATGGYTKRDNLISDEVDANILIFGSSRAAHHYVPSILSDSLDMSCYNCGLDGQRHHIRVWKAKNDYGPVLSQNRHTGHPAYIRSVYKRQLQILGSLAAVLSISGSRFIILGHKSVRTLENDVEFLPVQFRILEHSNG